MGVVGMDPLFSGCLGSVRQKSQPMEQPCDQWHYEGDGNGDDNDDDNVGEVTGNLDDGDDHTCKKRVMWRRRLFWPKCKSRQKCINRENR